MTAPAPIVCTYRRDGWRVIGRCPELGLETPPLACRSDAEAALVRLVLADRHAHQDDLCFEHRATESP